MRRKVSSRMMAGLVALALLVAWGPSACGPEPTPIPGAARRRGDGGRRDTGAANQHSGAAHGNSSASYRCAHARADPSDDC